jgi:O-antigen/teichoic acid export membrane protein
VTTVPTEASRRRALGDVLVQVAGRVLNLGLGIIVTVVLARTLGDTGYGQWLTLLALFQLAGYFTNFGLEMVAVREAAARPEEAEDWVGALVVTRIALSVPVMAVAVGVLLFLHEGPAMFAAGLILVLEIPFGVGSSLKVVHQLRMRNTLPMVVLTVQSVAWGIAVVAISVLGGGLVALAVAMTATTALASAVQAVAALRLVRFHLRPSRAAIVRLLRTGGLLGVAGLLMMSYARVDQVMVFEIAGAREAGLYGSVYRMLDQAHFVPVSVMTTLSPLIAALWVSDRERLVRVLRLGAEFLAIGSLGALAFAIVASEPVVVLLFGEEFRDAAPALPVLGGAFVFVCFGYLTSNMLLVSGLVRKGVVVTFAGLVVNVVGNIILIPRYGFIAAAWTTLVTEIVVVAFSVYYVSRVLPMGRAGIGRLPRVVAAAGATLLVLAAADAVGLPLAGLVVLFAVAYPALLFGLRAVEVGEIKALRGGTPA